MKKLYTVVALSIYVSFSQAKPFVPDDNFVVLNIDKKNEYQYEQSKTEINAHVKSLLLKAKKNQEIYGKIESILLRNKNIVNSNNELKYYYANVLQHRHAFEKAKEIIKNVPLNKANILRANIHMNLGEYKQAEAECKKLIGKADILIVSTCILHAESYMGRLDQSYKRLKRIYKSSNESNIQYISWVLTALAEMSSRLGFYKQSINYYQKANEIIPNDSHILSERVDLLYEIKDYQKIISLLENNHRDTRLNLRYQRALNKLNMKNKDLERLHQDIVLLELRQDKRHYDTRAEYYIWIHRNPEKALHWARNNWSVAKTIQSAKLLLAAAVIAKDKSDIKKIRGWFRKTSVEDTSLQKTLDKALSHEVIA